MSGETSLHIDGHLVRVKAGTSVAAALRVSGGMGAAPFISAASRCALPGAVVTPRPS